MNRKIMLLPLTLAAAFSLVACGGNDPASSSSEPTSSQSTGEVTVSLSKTTLTLEVGKFERISATVTGTTNQNVTWSSADPTIATVESGAISGKKIGTTTVTATSDFDNTKSATVTVTVVEATLNIVTTTVDALVAGTNINDSTIYEVEGILEGLRHNDQYGNAYLSDPVSGKSVTIYGLTTTKTAIAATTDGKIKYTNPKDAKTTLADVNNGEKVKVQGIYSSSFKNISCVLLSHEASDLKCKVTIENTTNGTVIADKTEYGYGDVVTLTITPASEYHIGSVNVLNTQNKNVSCSKISDVIYKFNATVANKVTVTFESDSVTTRTVTVSADLFKDKIPTSSSSVKTVDTEFSLEFGGDIGPIKMGGMYIYCGTYSDQSMLMLYKNKSETNKPYLYNKDALPGNIISLTVETCSTASANSYYQVDFGSAALSSYTTAEGKNIGQGKTGIFNSTGDSNAFFQIATTNGTNNANGNIVKFTIVYEPTE